MNKDRIIFALPRGGGKTYQAIKLAEKTGAQIVCFNPGVAASVKAVAEKSHRTIIPPISIFELKAQGGNMGRQLIFEDIDCCLCSLLGFDDDSIIGITVTTEDNTGN